MVMNMSKGEDDPRQDGRTIVADSRDKLHLGNMEEIYKKAMTPNRNRIIKQQKCVCV